MFILTRIHWGWMVLIVVIVLNISNVSSQVLINEIQSSNVITLRDEFNEYPDWIELYNASDTSVNLQGWCLSDQIDSLNKWMFPDFTLGAGKYCYVFASGRDIKQIPSIWSTVLDWGNTFRYIIPSDTVSDSWKGMDYIDELWTEGKSGFGYGDNDDSTTIAAGTVCVYVRRSFMISDISAINSALLHIDYDDGFCAYINGIEVARVNLGAFGSSITYNQTAGFDHEAIIWQGGEPELFDISDNIGALKEGENVFCIEVHNVSTTSSDLSLIPFLTLGTSFLLNDLPQVSKHLNLGSSVPHTNFKIKSDGEIIILSNSEKTIVDSISPVVLESDLSYGRLRDNRSVFKFFTQPTPGSENPQSGFEMLPDDAVQFSHSGGFISDSISLTLSNAYGDVVNYSTDGSEPNSSSDTFTTPIVISGNAIVKAKVSGNSYVPGKVYSHSFFIGRKPDLPIVSLTTAPENLWDDITGMYVLGLNANSTEPYYGANFWMDWEKPFNFEYFDESGACQINQGVGGKIFGGWSRAVNEQRSFAFYARKSYGAANIDYPLFKEKDIESFEAIVLRNSGNDFGRSNLRDGFITNLTSHLGVDYQGFKPVATYLNGEYWGIYNIREKVNEHFIADNHNLNSDDVNILEGNGRVVVGSNSGYIELLDFLNSNSSINTNEKYSYVKDRIDIDNYIKYELIQIFAGNTDWPGNNIKYWNSNLPGSKWRWILYDTDFGFGVFDPFNYTNNTLAFALESFGPDWPNPPWSTLLFRRLVTNTKFRYEFINQFADNINTTFLRANIKKTTDSLAAVVRSEMSYHRTRWGMNPSGWEVEIERIKNWGSMRSAYMLSYIQSTFNLNYQRRITLNISEKGTGSIRINTIYPKDYPFSGTYFQGVPIELEAIPKTGYKFVGWSGDIVSSERIVQHDLQKTSSVTAIFEQISGDEDINVVINEINYNSGAEFDPGDWVELYNSGNATIDISGYVFSDLVKDSGYVFQQNTSFASGDYLVVAKNVQKFKEVFPFVKNVFGGTVFGLSSNGDELRVWDNYGNNVDAVDYLSYNPWPDVPIGTGATLELIHPFLDNSKPENWVASAPYGTPGAPNSAYSPVEEYFTGVTDFDLKVFPNKFSDYTTISFYLPQNSDVRVEFVDIQGKLVDIYENKLIQGWNTIDWVPGNSVPNGMYIIKIFTNIGISNKNIIYLK